MPLLSCEQIRVIQRYVLDILDVRGAATQSFDVPKNTWVLQAKILSLSSSQKTLASSLLMHGRLGFATWLAEVLCLVENGVWQYLALQQVGQ